MLTDHAESTHFITKAYHIVTSLLAYGNNTSAAVWYIMKTFSTSLAFCAGNSPVTGEFPTQRPVTQIFDVFFDLHLNKQWSKQWRHRWFATPCAHYGVIVMNKMLDTASYHMSPFKTNLIRITKSLCITYDAEIPVQKGWLRSQQIFFSAIEIHQWLRLEK